MNNILEQDFLVLFEAQVQIMIIDMGTEKERYIHFSLPRDQKFD